MRKKIRPLGQITGELELLLEELVDQDKHDLQHGEVLALVHMWLQIHAPMAQEIYEDGSSPVFYYGVKE